MANGSGVYLKVLTVPFLRYRFAMIPGVCAFCSWGNGGVLFETILAQSLATPFGGRSVGALGSAFEFGIAALEIACEAFWNVNVQHRVAKR